MLQDRIIKIPSFRVLLKSGREWKTCRLRTTIPLTGCPKDNALEPLQKTFLKQQRKTRSRSQCCTGRSTKQSQTTFKAPKSSGRRSSTPGALQPHSREAKLPLWPLRQLWLCILYQGTQAGWRRNNWIKAIPQLTVHDSEFHFKVKNAQMYFMHFQM